MMNVWSLKSLLFPKSQSNTEINDTYELNSKGLLVDSGTGARTKEFLKNNPSAIDMDMDKYKPTLTFPYTMSRFDNISIDDDFSTKERILKEVGIDNTRPIGFQVLIKLHVRKTTMGALELPTDYANQDQFNTREGLILDFGPDAFSNKYKFPNGPWCKPGEWVIFARYQNSIFGVNGVPLSLINDDQLLGVIDDPDKMDTSQSVGK